MSNQSGTPAPVSRDELRGKLLANPHARFKRVSVKLFDQDIDLVQPSINRVLNGPDADKDATLRLIIDHAMVPGTETKVFEEGDLDTLKQFPFADLQPALKVMNELVGIDTEKALKNFVREGSTST